MAKTLYTVQVYSRDRIKVRYVEKERWRLRDEKRNGRVEKTQGSSSAKSCSRLAETCSKKPFCTEEVFTQLRPIPAASLSLCYLSFPLAASVLLLFLLPNLLHCLILYYRFPYQYNYNTTTTTTITTSNVTACRSAILCSLPSVFLTPTVSCLPPAANSPTNLLCPVLYLYPFFTPSQPRLDSTLSSTPLRGPSYLC